MRSNGSGYPSGKIVIHRSNGLAIRSKNCHPFQRLELSVPKYCQPLYCSKPLSPDPRRPRGSQSAREERCKRGARGGGGGEPLGTDSHQTISKRSSEFWLQKLSLRFLLTKLTATKNLKSFSFLYNLVLYSFLFFFPFLYYLNRGLTYTVNVH